MPCVRGLADLSIKIKYEKSLPTFYRGRCNIHVVGRFISVSRPAEEKMKVEKTVSSPDGKISLVFSLKDGTPSYTVNFKKKPVILSSPLGFELKDGSMKSGFDLLNAEKSSKDETWTQPWGEQKEVRNHYNELDVTLQQAGDPARKLRIIFRVFDDAVAFRYEWPQQAGLTNFEIMDELTEFVLASDSIALWQPALRPQQTEQLYAKTRLSELLRQTRLEHGDAYAGDNPKKDPIKAVTTPLTMQTDDGLYLVIHEADLTDYAAMELQPKDNNTLKCYLAPWSDGVLVKASVPSASPWRFVMITDKLSDIVEDTSAISLNLNRPRTSPIRHGSSRANMSAFGGECTWANIPGIPASPASKARMDLVPQLKTRASILISPPNMVSAACW